MQPNPAIATGQCEVRYGYDPVWLDQALEIYNKTELKRSDREKVDRAFGKSQVVVSAWEKERLIGIARMLTDFEMYAAIFDVVVDPAFQRRGVGRLLMQKLIEQVPNACIHLTSTFGNEAFYYALGFRFHKSAMARYPESRKQTPYLDWNRRP